MNPRVVLVHGAWHGPWCWERVLPALRAAGTDPVTVELPGPDLHGDIAHVTGVLAALDSPVLLVGHSYGGAVITGAGAHPAVRHLVYLAAFPLAAGESCAAAAVDESAAAGVVHPERSLADELVVDGDAVVLTPAGVRMLYSDCDDATIAWAADRLRPQPTASLRQSPTAEAWRDRPSTYVVCDGDEAVVPSLQRVLAARCTESVTWPTGHSPFASRPDLVTDLLVDRAGAMIAP